MVPRMQQQPLRAHHRDGRLLRDEPRRLQRRGHDLCSPALHDFGDEPERQRLVCGEGARGVGELAHEGLVARGGGDAREGADVCGQPDVDFLRVGS